jgi:hypothetical protein
LVATFETTSNDIHLVDIFLFSLISSYLSSL